MPSRKNDCARGTRTEEDQGYNNWKEEVEIFKRNKEARLTI